MKKEDLQIQKIDGILNAVLSDKGYLKTCREYDVINNWEEIAGTNLSKKTKCVNVDNNVLHVRVSSASWRQELTYMKNVLLGKVKKKCGSIQDIKFS